MKTKGKIKIFAFPSHQTLERTSGVDFARVIQPMKHLNGYKSGDVEFEVRFHEIDRKVPEDWQTVCKEYDIIFFNYLHNPWGFAAMGAMARANGVKLVLDLDDSLWNVKSDNSAHDVFHKGSDALRNFTAICNEVDYMTTTNDYLKHVVMNNTTKKADRIRVLPNFVDLSLYSYKPRFKDTGQIQLTHFGSSTHYNDLMEDEFMKGMDRILSEYPNVSLKFVGAFIPKFAQRWSGRYTHAFGHVDIYKWVEGKFREYMDETDIMIVPLTDDIYNRCKSSIKFLESGSAGKPGIWQNMRQYQEVVEDGKNGFLAGKDTQWYRSVKALIDDPKLRQSMGEAAYQTVVDGWQMKDNVKYYADFFRDVLDK